MSDVSNEGIALPHIRRLARTTAQRQPAARSAWTPSAKADQRRAARIRYQIDPCAKVRQFEYHRLIMSVPSIKGDQHDRVR